MVMRRRVERLLWNRESVRCPVDLNGPRRTFFAAVIKVTDTAVRQLKSLLAEKNEAGGKGLRVRVAKGGCSGMQYEMTLDQEQPGDAVIDQDGVPFLVDAESAPFLQGATLDFNDGLTGAGFHIANPNAARTCGCGSSFEVARPA
jgi:iron-sulfur cluster assembly protein